MNESHFHPLLDLTLLDRYLADELAADDRVPVESWLDVDPIHKQRLHTIQALGDTRSASHAESLDVNRAWERVVSMRASLMQAKTPFVAMDRYHGIRGEGRQPLRRVVWSAAAMLVLGLVVMVLSWTAGVHHISRRIALSTTTYTTESGERATITLPDGSTAALNVASRLEVAADYGSGNRIVRLIGEGLFTVAHNDGAPFTVIAGATATRVLGTSFVVRHYVADTSTIVAVRDGRVAVRSTVLSAAQMMEIGRTGMARIRAAGPAQFSFANGVLTLDGGLLPDVIPELDRWYDADIRLGDTVLKGQRMTAKLKAGSLSELKDILEETFNVRAVREGRVLTLFPR